MPQIPILSPDNYGIFWLHLKPVLTVSQWISEVLHFCQGLPIILVGCKKDLRHDPKTIEELNKTSQSPVTAEQVSQKC